MVGGGGRLLEESTGVRTRRAVVLLGAAVALSLMGDTANYIVLPVHFAAFGLAPMQVGILLSANRWVRLLTNQLARRTYDRARPALPLAAALLAGALLAAFYGTGPVFGAWLAARLAWGLCWSFIRHGGVTLSVSTATQGTAGRVLGIYNGIVQLGFITGTLAGGLLADAVGVPAMFLVAATVSATAVPLGIAGAARVSRQPAPSHEAGGPPAGSAADLALLAQAFL
jgi:predicted MFS family arabinose efflux permease